MIGRFLRLVCPDCGHEEGDHHHSSPRYCAKCTVEGGKCSAI